MRAAERRARQEATTIATTAVKAANQEAWRLEEEWLRGMPSLGGPTEYWLLWQEARLVMLDDVLEDPEER